MQLEDRIKGAAREVKGLPWDDGATTATRALHFPANRAEGRKRTLQVGMVAGTLAATATVAVVLIPARAVGLEEVRQALRSVPASHSRFYFRGAMTMERWQEGSKRRYRISDQIDRAYTGKFTWAVFERQKYVHLSSEPPFGFGQEGTGVENEIESAEWGAIGKPSVTERRVVKDNVSFTEFTVFSRSERTPTIVRKAVLLCRLKDKLPIRVDYSSVENGKERHRGYQSIDYPIDIDDRVFELKTPDGIPVFDEVKAASQIESRLSSAAFQRTDNGSSVNLLGVFTERNGTAYVLFTADSQPHVDATAGLIDSAGKGYAVYLAFESDDRTRPRNNGVPNIATQAPVKGTKKTFHGMSADYPIDLRPLCYIGGKPIYALQARVEKWFSKAARNVVVVLPLLAKSPSVRVERIGRQGVYVRGGGKPIGSIRISDQTVPVVHLYRMLNARDPKMLPSWDTMSIQGVNVDNARQMRLLRERLRHP